MLNFVAFFLLNEIVVNGTKTDVDGNPLPVSAKRVIINSSDEEVFSADYGKYDNIRKTFTKIAMVDLKQQKFEGKDNLNSDALKLFGIQ